jgi:hypothetical protein
LPSFPRCEVVAPRTLEYNKFSAKFKCTPSNHRGIESIRADSSTTFVYEPL